MFRVVLASGAEYLMQCEDTQSMLHWVTAIHRYMTSLSTMVVGPTQSSQFSLKNDCFGQTCVVLLWLSVVLLLLCLSQHLLE